MRSQAICRNHKRLRYQEVEAVMLSWLLDFEHWTRLIVVERQIQALVELSRAFERAPNVYVEQAFETLYAQAQQSIAEAARWSTLSNAQARVLARTTTFRIRLP